MLLFNFSEQQAGAELVVGHHFNLLQGRVEMICARTCWRRTQLVLLLQLLAQQKHRAQVGIIFEPFYLNGRLAIEHLAHEHEAHTCPAGGWQVRES